MKTIVQTTSKVSISPLHPRNRHHGRYDFTELTAANSELKTFVQTNAYGDESIDFFDPLAVKQLNRALLMLYYDLRWWDIPEGYLCPPVPGRADYIHHIADIMAEDCGGRIPTGAKIKVLDIGVGANCVYPVIGHKEYGWSFVGSDINKRAIASANKIIEHNSILHGIVECRLQKNSENIFEGIIGENEFFDAVICNPPFHASAAEAQAGTLRKVQNLKRKKVISPVLNFGGQHNELWCEGGEARFVSNMIDQSRVFSKNCRLFSSLISKEATLKVLYQKLKSAGAAEVQTITMGQGSKISRIIVWKFHP